MVLIHTSIIIGRQVNITYLLKIYQKLHYVMFTGMLLVPNMHEFPRDAHLHVYN